MEPFLGEIKINAFSFAPRGWAKCDGALMPISQNQALFALLGVQFGGDGRTTFQLPDMRGRTGMGATPTQVVGVAAGVENVVLTTPNLPTHTHVPSATTAAGNQPTPNSGIFAASPTADNFLAYGPATGLVAIAPTTLGSAGGSQPHANVQPSTTLNFCIALTGIFPPRQ